jgi:ribose/xylose/arabinose/galactoside ABC-type transport system permease subunit
MSIDTQTKQNNFNFKSIGRFFTKYGLAFVVLAVIAVFGILEPRMLTISNLMSVLTSACITAIAGMGLVVIMSSGEIDFAIGMEFTVAGIMLMMMVKFSGLNYWIVLVLVFIMLLIFGLLNAFFNIKIGEPAFLATMGTSLVAQFAAWQATGGFPVTYQGLPKIVTFWGQGLIFGIIPVPVVIFVVVSIIMIIYTERTKSGKKMYAVGSNPTACDFVGINYRREKLKGFVICAILAGLAGLIQSSQFNRANPAAGTTLLSTTLTALMLGATFLRPGVFNIPGTIIGSLLLSIIGNGLLMVSAPSYMQNFVTGAIMFTSVIIITIIRKNTEKVGNG